MPDENDTSERIAAWFKDRGKRAIDSAAKDVARSLMRDLSYDEWMASWIVDDVDAVKKIFQRARDKQLGDL